MIKLIDLIEAKQVGILYHFLPFETLINVLKNNCLKNKFASGQEKIFNLKSYYVSFTRNKDFNQIAKIFNLRVGINYNPDYVGGVCRLTIDGNSLSNNYSIKPVRDGAFSSTDSKSKWSQTPKVVKKGKKSFSADENEERIYTNQCIPINKYITEITLINPSEKEIEIINNMPEFSNIVKIV